MRTNVFWLLCTLMLLACLILIVFGCARLRRVGKGEFVSITPPRSIAPPIVTVAPAPPESVVEAPQPIKVADVEEEKPIVKMVAIPVEVKREFDGLRALLSELQEAASIRALGRVDSLSLRILVKLAQIEVMAIEHLKRSEDVMRVSDVVQTMDEIRARLREAKDDIRRGSIKVAIAAIEEAIESAKTVEELLLKTAELKGAAPQTGAQPTEKRPPTLKPSPGAVKGGS